MLNAASRATRFPRALPFLRYPSRDTDPQPLKDARVKIAQLFSEIMAA